MTIHIVESKFLITSQNHKHPQYQPNPVQSQNINANLNLGNQKYKEKGKKLGLPFEEPKFKLSSNHSQEKGVYFSHS